MNRVAVLLAALTSLPLDVRADYYVLGGDVMEGAPAGGDLSVGAWERPYGLAMVESRGVNITGATFSDELDGVGRFGSGGMAPPPPATTTVSMDVEYTVHLLHFELPAGGSSHAFQATVTFDAEIVAVEWSLLGLVATDGPPIGADYLQPGDFRGVELGDRLSDAITRSGDGVTLELELTVDSVDPIDQVRVITLATPPDADVFVPCEGIVVTVGPDTVTFEGPLRNDGAEPSLPIDLVWDWNPPRVPVIPVGELRLDGVLRTCDGDSPTVCDLGRIAPGGHRLRGFINGSAGETIGLDVALYGASVDETICHLEGTIPDGVDPPDAGVPGRDAGPPDPTVVIPDFHGGGGCRCAVGATRRVPWALLLGLALLVLWRRR